MNCIAAIEKMPAIQDAYDHRFPEFTEMSVVGDDRQRDAPLHPFSPEVSRDPGPGRILTVLCVFDNPAFLDRICRHLEMQGDIMVDISISVEDALHLMMYVPFDAIVTDYTTGTSESNGFLKSVRRCGNPVPFIYFTQVRDTLSDVESREYGNVSSVEWKDNPPFRGFEDLCRLVKQAAAKNPKQEKLQNGVFL
jgi:hypothetical protein